MKKVLVYGVSGNIGGIESLLYNVISNLNHEKVAFDVLTFYDNIYNQNSYKSMGVNVYKITSKHQDPIKNKKELLQFFREKANEYDFVWCNLAELINIDILKVAKKFGVKRRIIHSHSVASTRGRLLTFLHKINKKRIHKYATDFWACSKASGKWMFNEKILNSPNFKIIKNAVETSKYSFDEITRENIRTDFQISDNFVVGHVGRFSDKEKNTLFIIEIFAELLKLNNSSKLLLIGDGDDRALVERKIDEFGLRDNVLILGYREDVAKLLNAMDVFLLPSRMEGFGIVLVEAQINGLHCFTSKEVVSTEVQITDLVHYISLENSASEWAKKIVNCDLSNRKSKLKEIVSAGYDICTEAKRIEDLLRS